MKSVGRRRLMIWGGIGLVMAVLIGLAMAPKPVPVDMEQVVRGPLQVTLDHEGKTRIRDRFVISAPVDGRVRRIVLEPGDPVVAGETVLAIFDPAEPVLLDARSRAEAQARVKAAQSALAQARADRERARAEAELADSELNRVESLASQEIASQQQLDSATATARARSEAAQAADSAVRTASHELEAARARLMVQAGNTDGGASDRSLELRSPVDGVVLQRLRQSEAVVPMGEPLLQVADPADLEVIADFLSTDAVKIRQGMPVIIDQWGGDEILEGRVRRVEPAGFMKVSALGVEEQRVWVVVDFDDPRAAWEALGDEYRVEVRVVVWQGTDVLTVPTSALFRHDEGWAVFAAHDGRAGIRPVEIGRRNGLHAEVISGLETEEWVIAHPSDSVVEGVRVSRREG